MKRFMKLFALALLSMVVLTACVEDDADKSRQDDIKFRENSFTRAEQVHPVPAGLSNFPLREALVKFTLRQDLINHPWYIYIYNLDGSPRGYYVGQTYPQSACNFLSSSEKTIGFPHDGVDDHKAVVQAPSLDGVYYGGAGGSAACDSMFFFDMTTDAMVTFSANDWTATDEPVVGFTGPALGATSVENVSEAPVQEPEPVISPTLEATEPPE